MTRIVLAAAVLALCGTSFAAADDITPIRLGVTIAPVARLHQPLKVRVAVSADPSVLDLRTAPLRIRVVLASECGGEFAGTTGVVLLDKRLNPQPSYGRAYSAVATGSGKPKAYGRKTVCVYLEEEGDDRQFATDTSHQVDVSKACTAAAARFDRARRAVMRAGTNTRPLRRAVPREEAALKRARRACGPGVPL